MNNQEISEGNKLIAEFMGWKVVTGDRIKLPYKNHYYGINPITKNIYNSINAENYNECWSKIIIYVKYHSSWDWLMPVLEKIGVLKYSYQLNSLDNKMYYFWIHKYDEEGNDEISPIGYNGKWEESCIQVIFKAIIEFIKWYNKNNKL